MQDVYNQMWQQFESALNQHQIALDSNIGNASDDRRGITALAWLNNNNAQVCNNINDFLVQLQCLEPDQYYQPITQMHLTVLSIITCVSGFQLADINESQYREVFRATLAESPPVKVEFRGITASPACIVVQGFVADDSLTRLRNNLRDRLSSAGLHATFDTRYKIVTAHSTVMRFCAPVRDIDALHRFCHQARHKPFGTIEFTEFELVFNDWYQSQEHTRCLEQARVAL